MSPLSKSFLYIRICPAGMLGSAAARDRGSTPRDARCLRPQRGEEDGGGARGGGGGGGVKVSHRAAAGTNVLSPGRNHQVCGCYVVTEYNGTSL